MPVQHYDKAEIRELFRVAHRRGIRVPAPTAEQLNSPQFIQESRTRWGAYPDERDYDRARQMADHLGLRLTEVQRMNWIACRQFISACRKEIPDKVPSDKQIALGKSLAELKGIDLPAECEISYSAWNSFMQTNITREDLDLVHEASIRLCLGGIRLDSYGDQVSALARAKRLLANEAAAIHERVDEMLLGKCDPWEIGEHLGVDVSMVLDRERALAIKLSDI